MHWILNLLLLVQETPKVTLEEQIQLLMAQRDELLAENAALKAKLARIDKVNQLADVWNKRGCVVERTENGLVQCKEEKEAKEKK